jgi:hypothetical protein
VSHESGVIDWQGFRVNRIEFSRARLGRKSDADAGQNARSFFEVVGHNENFGIHQSHINHPSALLYRTSVVHLEGPLNGNFQDENQ